jgi:UDP-N-acetylmuramoyl-tripeptide--D-alanyl-D-alanine ligase
VKLLANRLQEYFQAKELVSNILPEYIDLHVVIDSRLVKPGDTFVCIQGEKTDGHNHIADAIKNGAIGFIVNRKVAISPEYFQIITDSPEIAIQKAASQILKEVNCKQIAITGSAGKTTTKELIYSIFNNFWKTAKTHGNYNTPIGVPVSIINMEMDSDFFLCELSASYPGEIDQNLSLMNLDAGIITGIGSSHLEFFGSIEKIFTEKMKITRAITNKGPLLINGDQMWGKEAKNLYAPTITFGLKNDNDIQAFSLQKHKYGSSFKVRMFDEIIEDLTISTFGDHFIYDALPGIYLARVKGMPIDKIRQSLASFQAEKGRGKMIPWLKNSTIVDESYNANPYSFSMSLQSFKNYQFPRKIAIIGDMLELGPDAQMLHIELGKMIKDSGIHIVIYKGQYKDAIRMVIENSSIEFYSTDTVQEIEHLLLSILQEEDGILIKASNGIGLHELVNLLEKHK